jgi:release factor glutamine methyltransferase
VPASLRYETIATARGAAMARLTETSDTPALDADLLLGAVLGLNRTGIWLRPDELISPDKLAAFETILLRRLAGEPVAYITGHKAFRALDLYVDHRVLVPRPETEQMVDLALDWLGRRRGPVSVVDVGTGSGAIALSLAQELEGRANVSIVASDVSAEALEVAAINRERLGLEDRVRLIQANLLDFEHGGFDLILANLPYLRPDQRNASIASEPDLALYAGEDGFDLYRKRIRQAARALTPGGLLVAEIDPDQAGFGAAFVEDVLERPVRAVGDLAGLDRFLVAGLASRD